MKEYLKLIEKLHPDSDALSVIEKYKILDSVLSETKLARIGFGIFAFILGALFSGLAFGLLKFSPQEPLEYVLQGSISSGLAYLCYFASQKIVLTKHIKKRYASFNNALHQTNCK
jgi:hypothetical protein